MKVAAHTALNDMDLTTPAPSGIDHRDPHSAVSSAELRLLRHVPAAEAAARTGVAGDSAEMERIAGRRDALERTRVDLGVFRRKGRRSELCAPTVPLEGLAAVPQMAPTLT